MLTLLLYIASVAGLHLTTTLGDLRDTLIISQFLCHTCLCSGLTPISPLSDNFCWTQETIGGQASNLGWPLQGKCGPHYNVVSAPGLCSYLKV